MVHCSPHRCSPCARAHGQPVNATPDSRAAIAARRPSLLSRLGVACARCARLIHATPLCIPCCRGHDHRVHACPTSHPDCCGGDERHPLHGFTLRYVANMSVLIGAAVTALLFVPIDIGAAPAWLKDTIVALPTVTYSVVHVIDYKKYGVSTPCGRLISPIIIMQIIYNSIVLYWTIYQRRTD
eukprot:4370294-Prymnesium_polylepis.1